MRGDGREVHTREVTLVSVRTSDDVLLHGTRVHVPDAPLGILGIHGAWGNFYANPTVAVVDAAPARGWSAAAMNSRAHDLGSIGDGEPCIGFMRAQVEDSPKDFDAAADVLRDAGVGAIVVVAHSFGAHLAAYWLHEHRPADVVGLAMLSPAPLLTAGAKWFVEGTVEHHLARAAAAVAEGDPQRLIVLSSHAPVPMVVEAATALSVWGPESKAISEPHVGALDLPILVTIGRREPAPYRDRAASVARAAGVELVDLDDDHYYANHPDRLATTVLDWIGRHCLAGADLATGAHR